MTPLSWLGFAAIFGLLSLKALCEKLPIPAHPRHRRQLNEVSTTIEEICRDKSRDEFFRPTEGGNCRDAARCDKTYNSKLVRLATIRCPIGLAFDIDTQVCNWKRNVKNCEKLQKSKKLKPLFVTDEPLCPLGQLACASGQCLDVSYFCDSIPDCEDGSDENACSVEEDPNRSPVCDRKDCELPECFCSIDGTQIPGGLEPQDTPQMITITFSGAVNVDNMDLYTRIFSDENKNPNDCQIKGTFFVSHRYTNYSSVQELHRKGNEIAVFSITGKDDPLYWTDGTYDDWLTEMAGARLIIEKFSNITDNSVIGIRAPHLRVGGNVQFEMMTDQLFVYDASITAPLGRVPIWPYTLYYRMPHKCQGNAGNCPSRSYPVWEMVMNELDRREDEFEESLSGCHFVGSCTNIRTAEQFRKFLRHNFDRHYNTNRAPLGLHFQAAWLKGNPEFLEELLDFIDEKTAQGDVYFVTMLQAIQWMQEPTAASSLREFEAWKEKCDVKGQPFCSFPNTCPLTSHEKDLRGEILTLNTCMECPQSYPWLYDPTGDDFELL